jgi:hypothetical protein
MVGLVFSIEARVLVVEHKLFRVTIQFLSSSVVHNQQ